jgi:hypothetical protein
VWAKGLTKEQRDISQQKLDEYWKDAKKFVKVHSDDPKDPSWFAFKRTDPARRTWESYFLWRLGFLPIGLSYLEWGTIKEFLVPCERPNEFDTTYGERHDA